MINCVITNSSPQIVLFKSIQAELLPQLFNEILVPEAVFQEVTVAYKYFNKRKERFRPGLHSITSRAKLNLT